MKRCLTNIQDFMEMLESTGKRVIAFGTGMGYINSIKNIDDFITILCDNWRSPEYAVGENKKDYLHHFGNIEEYIDFLVDNDPAKKGTDLVMGGYSFRIYDTEILSKIDSARYVILLTVIKNEYKDEILNQLEKIDNLREIMCYSAFDDMHYYDRKNRGLVIERIILPHLGAVNDVAWRYIEDTHEEYRGYSENVYDDVKNRVERGEYINHWIEFHITTICNLRCKYCAAHIPKLPEHHHVPIEQVLNDIDIWLDVIDDCIGVQLGTGEAVLYPQLDIVLEKLCSNKKVKVISIVTNGIKYPTNEKVLRQLADPKVVIVMSNYNMPRKTDITREFYKKHEISVIFLEEQKYWSAMGEHIYDRMDTRENLILKFMNCCMAKACPQVIYEGKMYSCGKTARFIDFCDLNTSHDYVDFEKYTDTNSLKKALIELRMEPYLDSCGWCDVPYKLAVVSPGEQIEE